MSVTCDRSVVLSTNETHCHDIAEILLKVALNTINQTYLDLHKDYSINDQQILIVSLVWDMIMCKRDIFKIYWNWSNVEIHNDTSSGFWIYGVKRHVQQHFSYIVAASFIGGGNQSTQRKPPTCWKSLTNWVWFELTTLVVIGTDSIGSYKSNYHTIMTTSPPTSIGR